MLQKYKSDESISACPGISLADTAVVSKSATA
jgi:hypothetical protein